MGALQSSTLFSSNINLITSQGKVLLNHILSCSEYYWDLWPNLKWLSRLNSQLKTYRARLILFALKFGLCPSDATILGYPPLPVHIWSCLFFCGDLHTSCFITHSPIWVLAHFQGVYLEPGMPSLGLEQRIQTAHSNSKAINILQYLNELTIVQVI